METENELTFEKKQYHLLKIISCMVAGILAVTILCAVILVPKAVHTLNQVDEAAEQAGEALKDLNQVADELASADLPGLIQRTDNLITQSGESIGSTMEKVNAMDIETLNEAISDLKAVVEPLSRLFGNRK